MQQKTINQLLELNQQFYQTFALPFSSKRMKIQPGIRQLLPDLISQPSILDLGCGNGELALELYRSGFRGRYVGLDFSVNLLEIAKARVEKFPYSIRFYHADLSKEEWFREIQDEDFTAVVAFAVLHHIPSIEYRLRLLQDVRKILMNNKDTLQRGKFYFSVWQFLHSERQRKRIHEWQEVGLSMQEVDENDYLLDWKEGGFGFRYVHHFSEEELNQLAQQCGFVVQTTFYSDGKEGNLALYQIWEVQSMD
ncbi:MAG: class I SAM-dependent methyltransferase [Anaerolineales bacterium]